MDVTQKIMREVKHYKHDEAVKLNNYNKVCTKSCPACCHQHITVHLAEGHIIEEFIKDMSNADRDKLRSNVDDWLTYFSTKTADVEIVDEARLSRFEMETVADKKPCPMLINKQCAIYKVRPIVCMTHFVTDNPELCSIIPNRNGDDRGIKKREEMFSKIIKDTDMLYFRPLAYAVQEVLGCSVPCKPILINIYPTLKQ